MERVLHRFGGSGDGVWPVFGDLIDVKGKLYGTTSGAGANNAGTVFTITPSGKETTLYNFGGFGSGDAAGPWAGLINVNGALYGTTFGGGTDDFGAVFTIAPSGKETVLSSFVGGSGDGREPVAGLINVKGILYGTTYIGGGTACGLGCGTVFAITPSGKETVLHSFAGSGDGSFPYAGLINVKGALYGTTSIGGGTGCGGYGCGAVFTITPSGIETVLYSFGAGGSQDGANPYAGLLNVNGTLYGTTRSGGRTGCDDGGCGTVFAITPSGSETVLHRFGGSGDGVHPYASLVNVNGKLYGTTREGGASTYGTVFAITPSGTETVLHSFSGSADGVHPYAGLIDVNGTLYGTTYQGGGNNNCARGCGTVFSITP
jgi:uncharacterized repeat protein (TIGR03803 family)